jgi:ferrous iron transport protein B
VDGVIAGVGSVLVFLPQILILYFFILILEDSGYMARAAFLMDSVMSRVGLNGRVVH